MGMLSWVESQGERRWLLAVVAVALIVRLTWAGLIAERQPRFDELAYVGHAVRLSQSDGHLQHQRRPARFLSCGSAQSGPHGQATPRTEKENHDSRSGG